MSLETHLDLEILVPTKAIMSLASERGVPPPSKELTDLITILNKQRSCHSSIDISMGIIAIIGVNLYDMYDNLHISCSYSARINRNEP